MNGFTALVLAIALSYVIGDFFSPYLPGFLSLVVYLVLCLVIFKVANRYFKYLKE